MNNFDNHTFENTQPIFTNINTTVRVVDIYDGDTCTVVIKLHDEYFKHSVRLCGIDTCEMKSKDEANKMNAVKARNRLYELVSKTSLNTPESSKKSGYTRNEIRKLLNTNVYLCYLKIKSLDKYGRLLVELFDNDLCINQSMIDNKFAVAYDGGTKQEFCDIIT
jgi:endonuclease YncB( thermonuclease family)